MTTTQLFINQPWKNDKKLDDERNEKIAERVQEIAALELKEDEKTRNQCLNQIREWLLQNKDIENCITDDIFLLRFLRVKKYSLHMTQQMILKYLNLRRCFSHMFNKLDYLEPNVHELISTGYIFVSPFKDKNGRRVIITIPRKFDSNVYNSIDMTRAHLVIYETLMEDENNQILGVTHVGDIGDASASLITMWSINEFATLLTWGEQSFPMRHKEIHILNLATMYKYVYDFAASRVSPKIRERVKLHDSTEQLHKELDPMILPAEYGGIMPISEMVEAWKNEMAEKRDRLLSYDRMKLLSDKDILRRRSKINQEHINGSFRKLDVD
ncbi:hypothetical protein FQA39_LY11062 [Lamprigera yunnana]|nr:hypothetical protein FQA39_LY11062 [Lamprigera yunnana]